MSSTEPEQSRSAYLQDLKGFVYTGAHTRETNKQLQSADVVAILHLH